MRINFQIYENIWNQRMINSKHFLTKAPFINLYANDWIIFWHLQLFVKHILTTNSSATTQELSTSQKSVWQVSYNLIDTALNQLIQLEVNCKLFVNHDMLQLGSTKAPTMMNSDMHSSTAILPIVSAHGELLIPRAISALKQRWAFSVIGRHSTWNELPLTLHLLPRSNVSSFYKLLKSFLFGHRWTKSTSEEVFLQGVIYKYPEWMNE